MGLLKFGWLKNGPAQIWVGSNLGRLKFGLAQIWVCSNLVRSNLAAQIWAAQKRLDTLLIPEEYTKYLDEHFLRVDTGPDDPERILIFATDEGLADLKKYRHWCSDGTFKSRPKIFYQIFMLHVCINETQAAPR